MVEEVLVPDILEMWLAGEGGLVISVLYTSDDKEMFLTQHPGLVYEDELQRLVELAETRGNC